MMVLIVDLSSFLHSIIACGFMYLNVILSGENMFVFVIFFYTIPFSVQFNSVTQLCPTLCDPMNRSTPGLPVHHQLPEFTQTHVH